MIDKTYYPILPLSEDKSDIEYELFSDSVYKEHWKSLSIIQINPDTLEELAARAIRDLSHLYRPSHLQQLRDILDDPRASENDRYVALEMLKNAVTSAEMVLPGCQDTGTAIVMAKKGEQIWTGEEDQHLISQGIARSYRELNLRNSQLAPLTMFAEKNTGTNLPAQIDIEAVPGEEYQFLFMTKGGGSANKTQLFQQTPAILNREKLLAFLKEQLINLGTAACPPYHLAIVIGGTSAEMNLKTVKLASARYLDSLPTEGNAFGQGFRDHELEAEILRISREEIKLGAQFGGRYFAHDVRVIRLPRHGASCPIGLGVSCSADRNILAKINSKGFWIEKLERNPARFLPEPSEIPESQAKTVEIDLNQSMAEIRAELSRHPVKTRIMLNGPIIVARDLAHAKLKERLDNGAPLPDYFKEHIIYYAGPARTPDGYASGSFGPTTAGRMDGYVDLFQRHGGSMIMLAKGNRSRQVTDACKLHGGFYLGSIGGAAARLSQDSITKVECIDFEELGMEAIYRIEVKNFPAFIIVDDKGGDFFSTLG